MYRHSVIPGGVYSPEELAYSEARDPVVAAHYAGFDLSRARMIHASEDRQVYVSYRIGSAVYWTRRPVRLAAAEMLVTDGEHEARARCGNRIADTAQTPTSPDEPPPAAMETREEALYGQYAAQRPGTSGTPYSPLLAQDIFPAPAPLEMAAGAAIPGVRLAASGPAGSSENALRADALGGGTGGIAPWRNTAPPPIVSPRPASNPVSPEGQHTYAPLAAPSYSLAVRTAAEDYAPANYPENPPAPQVLPPVPTSRPKPLTPSRFPSGSAILLSGGNVYQASSSPGDEPGAEPGSPSGGTDRPPVNPSEPAMDSDVPGVPAPEPATAWLALAAFGAALFWRRR